MNTTSTSYISSIDALRAIAVISVLLYHINNAILPGGFAGVDVFFVISGYVVAGSLYRHGTQSVSKYLLTFYSRRIVRIFPALIVCLVLTSLLAAVIIPSAWLSESIPRTGLYAFFGLSNFILAGVGDSYYGPRAEFNPFTHTWTLGVEEQFYLLFPVILWAYFSTTKSLSLAGAIVGKSLLPLLCLASFAYAAHQTPINPNGAFYLIFGRFWELAAGGVLWQIHRHYPTHQSGSKRARLGIYSGLALLSYTYVFASPQEFPAPMGLIPVLGTLLVLDGVVCAKSGSGTVGIERFFSNKVVLYIGKISYSLYLWHWPTIVFFHWSFGLDSVPKSFAAILISLAFATASYHLIENPMRNFAMTMRNSTAIILMFGFSGILGGWGLALAINHYKDRLSLSVTNDREIWYPQPWKNKVNPNFSPLRGSRVFFVGDSHAGAYYTLMQKLADEDGVEYVVYSKAGCAVPFLLAPTSVDCADWTSSTLDELRRAVFPGDTIFLPGLRLHRLADTQGAVPESRITELSASTASATNLDYAFEEALGVISQLAELPANIVLEAPKPVFRSEAYRCADTYTRLNPACSAGLTVDREYLLEYRTPVLESMKKLQKANPTIHIWDPFPTLCPKSICSALVGDKPLFFDSDHLSAHGNRVLYDSFQSFLISISHVSNDYLEGPVMMNFLTHPGLKTSGLSHAENWGRWTDGHIAKFSFTHGLPENFALKLNLNTPFGPNISGKSVSVRVGDQSHTFIPESKPSEVSISFTGLDEAVKSIEIDIPAEDSPSSLGLSADGRKLGLAIVSFQIVEIQEAQK